MNASSRWPISLDEQNRLIKILTENLLLLRAKLDISQEEISKIIGISRQTYSAIESKKRPMSWQVYLSLVLFFYINEATKNLLCHTECFPEILVDKTLKYDEKSKTSTANDSQDIMEMFSKLDEQAYRSVKTLLMVEYARCAKIPGEAVIKAFNGLNFTGSLCDNDRELDKAINNIKMRSNENGS